MIKPVAMPKVAPGLLDPPRLASCAPCPMPDAEAYPPIQLGAVLRCESAGRQCEAKAAELARNKHASLASAVRVREKYTDDAIKSAR